MDLKAPIPEIDDIQLTAESYDALPHANQSEPVALRNHAAVSSSAFDRSRSSASANVAQMWTLIEVCVGLEINGYLPAEF